VHQFQRLARPQLAHLLDGAEPDPAAAVAGEPAGLVQRDEVAVLEHDPRAEVAQAALGGLHRVFRRRDPHRRDAQQFAAGEALVGLGPLAVDAHLAGAQQAVDVGPRHALEQAEQEVVQALALAVLGHAFLPYPGWRPVRPRGS